MNHLDRKTNKSRKKKSYIPTINKRLVSLKTLKRPIIKHACNVISAFNTNEPLKIAISKTKCVKYDNPRAIHILLDQLRGNKHIDIDKIILPKQIDANCWFNVMFVMFFISDKGRKFFHFFRQFMITGKDVNGKRIPKKLKHVFALLNYSIELALTGSKYAVNMDTNNIIVDIYENMPIPYQANRFIPDWEEPGNPIKYYIAIMKYLNIKTISLMEYNLTDDWLPRLTEQIHALDNPPHVIVLNCFMNNHNKMITFDLKHDLESITYSLDSASVLDTTHSHFCGAFTSEGSPMVFDGLTIRRNIPFAWKELINKNVNWNIESYNEGKLVEWNFQRAYHQLVYYRI